MLRYRKFPPNGVYWTPEYGDAEHSLEEFKYLFAYSPLHNSKEGTQFPPVMVTTADHDDIVFPAHAEKFVASLQAKAHPKNPIILKFLPDMGHGFAGMSIEQIVDLQAD